MTDTEIILSAIREMNEAHNAGLKAIEKTIDAGAFVTNDRLNKVDNRFAVLNGSVARLQAESNAREQVVRDFRNHQKFGQWIHRNWWAAAILFVGTVTLIILVYDNVGLRGLWDIAKEVK